MSTPDIIVTILMFVIVIITLFFAFLPDIIGKIAGEVMKNRRITGMAMITHKKGGGYPTSIVEMSYIFAWIFVGLSVINIPPGNVIAFIYNAIMAFCYFRIVQNYKIGNALIAMSKQTSR